MKLHTNLLQEEISELKSQLDVKLNTSEVEKKKTVEVYRESMNKKGYDIVIQADMVQVSK